MLVVKVEIWPSGSEELRFEIGRLQAGNISDCAPVSSYEIRLSDRQGLADRKLTADFEVHGHHRSDGVWHLLHKTLSQAIEDGVISPLKRS